MTPIVASRAKAYKQAVANLMLDSRVDAHTWFGIGGHLSCGEADAFATFLRATDQDDFAISLLIGHAEADDEGDAHWNLDALPGATGRCRCGAIEFGEPHGCRPAVIMPVTFEPGDGRSITATDTFTSNGRGPVEVHTWPSPYAGEKALVEIEPEEP